MNELNDEGGDLETKGKKKDEKGNEPNSETPAEPLHPLEGSRKWDPRELSTRASFFNKPRG